MRIEVEKTRTFTEECRIEVDGPKLLSLIQNIYPDLPDWVDLTVDWQEDKCVISWMGKESAESTSHPVGEPDEDEIIQFGGVEPQQGRLVAPEQKKLSSGK